MVCLKRYERETGIVPPGFKYKMTIPGEPMIYSTRIHISNRKRHDAQYFRNKSVKGMLKARFPAYKKDSMPVVLIATFYLEPLFDRCATNKELNADSKPACRCFELPEYILSLMEMIRPVLMFTYKQIVKIDVEKFYSNNPRTVLQFMSWEHYVYFRDKDTLNPETESVPKKRKVGSLQPVCEGNESPKKVRGRKPRQPQADEGASSSNSTLPVASS